ncbi:GNAT family N-acetyltransferase [Desulfoluna spongiiphila]|uniref:Acetyltransferase (GNAT) domain-containing protein n=1 Tax=Desulfoluna spongiiphila TaxID=419481 RepID=A0A1G5DNE0_9BACT|nr:GNAT family N-acetyltransferase [Desulfoluna spongiiphila]SCY15950.1 Acetyltransferase (GNAT) domain-containing protein [Desulfoluna spongiiphila]
MEIKHRLPSIEEYQKLRNVVGWWDTDANATKVALNNSLFSVVAIEGETVVGIGRIAGDGGLYFYIQDVIVHPDYQSKGIGKALMKELMTYIKKTAKPGSYIALMSAKGLEKYYEAFGFEARNDDAPGVFQIV